jgi:hypothetical protein
MPVYLPEQKARATRQRNISLPTDFHAPTPPLIDTGGAGAKEIVSISVVPVQSL